MLLIVSDLHFVDESAGDRNLNPRTYEKLLASLNLPERIGRVKELEIVFLGDTFDVLRSHAWFGSDESTTESHRPWHRWADPTSAPAALNRRILRRVLSNERVRETCRILRDWKARLQDAGLPVRYRLIPGNHDRFLHVDPAARRDVVTALDLDDDVQKGFEYVYVEPEYRVVGFHGHEIDPYNFGRGWWENDPFSPTAYSSPSIGEAITIDVVARIPYEAEKRLRADGLDEALVQSVVAKLQNMESIRPVSAVFKWLDFVSRQSGTRITRILDDTISDVFHSFIELDFVQEWTERLTDRWIPSKTSALKKLAAKAVYRNFAGFLKRIRSVAGAENLISASRTEADGFERYERIANHPFYERLSESLGAVGSDRQYLVYGHTHIPEVVPLSQVGTERVLFNTGTFQPRMIECGRDGARNGFMTQKNLSFAAFYLDGEIGRDGEQQHYEFWEGRLAEEPDEQHSANPPVETLLRGFAPAA